MRAIWVVLIIIVILIVGAGVFMWSGIYDVAANQPQWKITAWFLEEVRERSIEVRSKDLSAPSSIDPKLIQNASYYFYGTCKICHGAPGNPPDKFSQGLDPIPPHMGRARWDMPTDGEIFWFIKNGVKMTGMASFEKVFNDDQIWGMVAFLKDLHKKAQESK
jgi:mono/diheme cytochrome c family protein